MKRLLLLFSAMFLAVSGMFAQLQFTPATLDFGQKPITSTSTLEVILTSQINQLISLSDLPAPFSASPDEFMIAIGEQKTVTITFHPMTVGSFSQTLTATGGVWGTAQLQISGQSIVATVSFSEGQHWFGEVLMTSYTEHIITITSNIAQQVGLSGLNLPFGANRSVIALLPNQPEQVIISFNPAVPGYFEDYLDATGSISGSHQIVLNGVATAASISTDPTGINFEPLFSGETDTIEIQVTTNIDQNISLSGLTDVFSVFPENLTMAAGEAQSIFISFAPANPGNFSQSLHLAGSLWGSVYVPVYGQCIDPQISVSPGQVDFGTIALLSSSTKYVTVYNSGNGMLECEVANDNPHFTVSPGVLNVSQGSSQGVAITFIPDFVPAEYDTLLITSNDPDTPLVKIPLQGQGMSQVSGDVCGTWYKANSPYNFTGSVTVPETCTLTIEPGVVVNMADYDFFVNGKLVCNGTLNDSIYLNGTGIFQLSASCPNDSIDYVVFDGGSTGEDGLTVKSFGAKIKNANIKAYQLINQGADLFYDDFEDGTWEDKWIVNNGNGYLYIENQYGKTGKGLYITCDYWSSESFGLRNSPIEIINEGAISVSFFIKIPNPYYNYLNRFAFRVNNSEWKKFYECYSTVNNNWTQITTILNYNFHRGDLLEILVENGIKTERSSTPMHIDEIRIRSLTGLEIINSVLNLGTLDQYSQNIDTIPSLKFHNSTIQLVDNIETNFEKSSIEMIHSTISKAGYDAIKINGKKSTVLMDNSSIRNVSGYAITINADSNNVILNKSTIENCPGGGAIYINQRRCTMVEIDSSIFSKCGFGLYSYFYTSVGTNFSNSPITITNSLFSENYYGIGVTGNSAPLKIDHSEICRNNVYGISVSGGNSFSTVEISNSIISNNLSYGIYADSYPLSTMFISGSKIVDNGGTGINCGESSSSYSYNVVIENSLISSNYGKGITVNPGQLYADHLTSIFNNEYGIVASASGMSHVFNSIVCGNHQFTGLQYSGNIQFSYSKFTGDPKLADSLGHLLPTSPCIDAADPTEEDAHIPYGMGTVRADMGAYGGPDNWIWGGEPIPTNGEPEIVHIVDLPQDQGKKVGIQFSASLFDNGHTAYDVSRYSFWRELDENGKLPLEASKTPVSQFFQKGTNYWEYVGEMPANGFANYGFSATTLGDSTVSGMFWSKFLVVAHTSDDNIYWVSQPDSGYSVDNLAPATPLNLSGTVAGVTYNLQWTPSPEDDFQYYAVYKAENGLFGEEPFTTTSVPEFSGIDLNNELQDFAVAAYDFSGNRSPLSATITAPMYNYLTISQGWSGISSWIQPENASLESIFAPVSGDLIILQNMQGVYWPGQNVNTLGAWNENAGYMVKMAAESQIPFIGHKNPEKDFQLTAGWQILPVLTNCPLSVNELQNQLSSNLVMVKEIAGWRVFWPDQNISTLETLEPGKAYFLNTLTGNGVVVFGECE